MSDAPVTWWRREATARVGMYGVSSKGAMAGVREKALDAGLPRSGGGEEGRTQRRELGMGGMKR